MDSRGLCSSVTENAAVYSPHLKKVLKSFQMTSMRSLNGPDTPRPPLYAMGYATSCTPPLDKDLMFTQTKSNLIAADGVYYKKRPKAFGPTSISVTANLSTTKLPTSHALKVPSVGGEGSVEASCLKSTSSSKGDNNNNVNDTTSANNITTTAANTNNNGNKKRVNIAQPVSKSSDTVNVKADSVETVAVVNEERSSFEQEVFLGPPPFPIQQVPILTAADQGWSESSTQLEGEMISCFVVGGEKRLCLPQILNTVLRDFSLPQINAVCDELLIYCSRCNQDQLDVLKMTGVLPPSAPSCGLVTKTDCERLCNALLHRYPPRAVHNLPPDQRPFHFRVYHECFGRCEGVYTPDHFTSPDAKCIECVECHGLLSPRKFVGHVHEALETRTCHWGFDSLSWRFYILVGEQQENMNQLRDRVDEMKDRFDATKNNRKRKQRTTATTTTIKAEAIELDDDESGLNRVVVDEEASEEGGAGADEEELEVKEDTTSMKKRKTEITAAAETYYPYVYDPVVACYYGFAPNPPTSSNCHPHTNATALSRLSAFRPWSPLLTTKEGKFNLNMPPNSVAAFLRESAPPPLPAFLSRGPPVLLNPERVVPVSETERFERHYQPNVALAPPSAQLQAKQKSHQISQEAPSEQQQQRSGGATATPSRPNNNKLQPPPSQQPRAPSKRVPESVIASSSSSSSNGGVRNTVQPQQQHRGYSDIELSTDTDETFSDSTTYSASGSPMSCSSRNLIKDAPATPGELDIFNTEMKFLRQLLDDEVTDREVRDKVLSKVARMCYSLEQKLEKSEIKNQQLQQELDFVKMTKRERLRENAESKRQLRKEVERMYEERISLERQINEMRKDSLSLSSTLQREIHLKREQTDEEELPEDAYVVPGELQLHPPHQHHPHRSRANDEETRERLEEDEEVEEEEEVNRMEEQILMGEEVEEEEDVKPNLGLLIASVSNGY